MNEDGFAALAVRSTKVRQEHRLLLEGLIAFEQKIIELVGGLGSQGCSSEIVLEESIERDYQLTGHTTGFLGFSGTALYVAYRNELHAPWDDYKRLPIVDVNVEWQRRLSAPEVLNSLLQNLVSVLDEDLGKTAPVAASLTQFVTFEKAQIDAELDAHFNDNPILYESWLKARKTVTTDSELSITLSCSHLETVLKKCLKTLGAEGYEEDPIEKLMSKAIKTLRDAEALDDATRQMLNGASSICHGIATIRNRKSVAHGKNDGYVQPTVYLAQTLNHLSGVVSIFIMRSTTFLTTKDPLKTARREH